MRCETRSIAVAALLLGSTGALPTALAWRSALYPEDWQPGLADASGRLLHDFSYAGYHRGETPIPADPPGALVDVTLAPYLADKSGGSDVTAVIQQAIDDVGAAGGGVVYLPAGTYRVRPPAGASYALYIGRSGVVLRGAGPDATFLFNDEPNMRSRRIVLARPSPVDHFSWYWSPLDERALATDVVAPTATVRLDDTAGYAVGDWIVVRADPTAAFIEDHGMTGEWPPETLGGPIFYRRIESIDSATGDVTLDVPLRYSLLTRDAARVNRIAPHLTEIGVEELALGNRQNDRPGTGDDDYAVPGTAAYEMHDSFGIYFNHVVDGWIRNVHSYRPAANSLPVHLLSNGIRLDASRFVTVEGVVLESPQYRGEGGNGYHVALAGQECLVTGSSSIGGRHNFSFGLMQTSGNVIHAAFAQSGRLPVDFHMHLSMANLLDNLTVDDDSLEAKHRQCCGHGHGTTQSVFWNTTGEHYPSDQWLWFFIVDSSQLGHGYIIGTRGPAFEVQTANLDDPALPVDFTEGVGQGDTLEPPSLYLAQRALRLGLGGEGGSGGGPAGGAGPGGGGAADDPGGQGPGGSGLGDGGTGAAEGGGTARLPTGGDEGCGCRLERSTNGSSGLGAAGLLSAAVGASLARRRRRPS